jgi:RND family efflux transporter MFP subunit
MPSNAGRFLGLIVVTAFAAAVMLASGTNFFGAGTKPEEPAAPQPVPPTPVELATLRPRQVEISDSYSGMLHPWEQFRIGFELAGRIESLGVDAEGSPLDEGATVSAGQVLAVLDQRALAARKREASAVLRRAKDELQRAEELRQRNDRAISDSVLMTRETEAEIAEAQFELAAKAVDDATLRAPVDGVIARRLLKPGEQVIPQQTVFEIVQVDRLLMVVGVPESRIRPIVERFNRVEARPAAPPFAAEIQLIGRDSLGRTWRPLRGEVHAVSQTSNESSGLFEVEIELPNPARKLRPGQIGVARLIIAELEAFRLPANAAVVRDDQLVLFAAETPDRGSGPVAKGDELIVQPFVLRPGNYVEQQQWLVVFDLPSTCRNVVTRGQHRLVPGGAILAASIVPDDADASRQAASPAAAASGNSDSDS